MSRKTPVLLRRAPLSGGVNALLRYTEKPHPNRPGKTLITAHDKQDVTYDFANVALDWLFDEHTGLQPVLRKVAANEPLTDDERGWVDDLADHLAELIDAAQEKAEAA